MSRQAWLAGASVGAAAGFLSLELPPAGWLIAGLFLVGSLRSPHRTAAVAGELVGFGGVWLALLGRVALQCQAPDGEIGCQAPGIEPWLATAGALLGVRLVLTAVAVRRAVRSRRGP